MVKYNTQLDDLWKVAIESDDLWKVAEEIQALNKTIIAFIKEQEKLLQRIEASQKVKEGKVLDAIRGGCDLCRECIWTME